MKPRKLEVITCPCCGREYLPAEIYLPNSFIGKPKSIVRNEQQQIESFSGPSMDVVETYKCDKCDSVFKVFARITFAAELRPNLNFDKAYESPVASNDLFLQEEDE